MLHMILHIITHRRNNILTLAIGLHHRCCRTTQIHDLGVHIYLLTSSCTSVQTEVMNETPETRGEYPTRFRLVVVLL